MWNGRGRRTGRSEEAFSAEAIMVLRHILQAQKIPQHLLLAATIAHNNKTKPDRNAWSLSLDSDTVTVALAPSMHLLLCLPSLALALAKPLAYLALTANLAWCLAAGRGRGLTTRKS